MEQKIIIGIADEPDKLQMILDECDIHKFLLVCTKSTYRFCNAFQFDKLKQGYVLYNRITPNPTYEQVKEGVSIYKEEKCDGIIALGGGSAIDVAKCIKLFEKKELGSFYLEMRYEDTGIPLIAIPTTAGTGSESTRHAVIYYKNEKQSISHSSIIPNYAILEPKVLKDLPDYYKKSSLLDALCQGIESWWSIKSTEESIKYSKSAVTGIVKNMNQYLESYSEDVAREIMLSANSSGRAINIAETTAAHAMSYKLAALLNISHGHAVAICLPGIWRYMYLNIECCNDMRGEKYIKEMFEQIVQAFGEKEILKAIEKFEIMLSKMKLDTKFEISKDGLDKLVMGVNPVRLNNTPVFLNTDAIREIYCGLIK